MIIVIAKSTLKRKTSNLGWIASISCWCEMNQCSLSKDWNSIPALNLSVAHPAVGLPKLWIIGLLKAKSPSGSINSTTRTWHRTDFKGAVHHPSSFLLPLSAKERCGLRIYVEGNILKKKTQKTNQKKSPNSSSKKNPKAGSLSHGVGVFAIHFWWQCHW